MLSVMIFGPIHLENDINVYLSLLVEDLKFLWFDGVEIFDVVASKTTMIHVMLFCTINDFPTYNNLSRYYVKDYKACPICEENTTSHQLKNGRKTIYLCH